MRSFGNDAPELFCFQITGGKKVYKVPLSASMPYSVLKKMKDAAGSDEQFEAQVEMLRKYMGDVVDELDAKTLSDILQAWAEASKGQGAEVGES
jgi:hypothetical protein